MHVPFEETLITQVFQISACDFRCWFCFVNKDRLSGNLNFASFLLADELVELYLKEPNRPKIIDLSGGQQNLVHEWILYMMKSVEKNNLTLLSSHSISLSNVLIPGHYQSA